MEPKLDSSWPLYPLLQRPNVKSPKLRKDGGGRTNAVYPVVTGTQKAQLWIYLCQAASVALALTTRAHHDRLRDYRAKLKSLWFYSFQTDHRLEHVALEQACPFHYSYYVCELSLDR